MEKINKDRVLADVVSTFFKYFTLGVIESSTGTDINERYEPRNVKQTMLNHYEHIAPAFNNEAFYSIFRLNYEEAEMESVLRGFVSDDTTQMDLVRLACRTSELYEVMVSEYKRNFELLLCGRIATLDEHERNYARCPSAGMIDLNTAENIINGIAANAYERGRKTAAAKNDNI